MHYSELRPMKKEKECIGVIGAGAMGSGIAQVAAQCGHEVVLVDQNQSALDKSQKNLASVANRLIEKERWTVEFSQEVQQSIVRTTDWNQLKPCTWIIEAIVEDLAVKTDVFRKLEAIVDSTAVLASNTSSLSLTAIAGKLSNPERFVGLHFFNPAPLMALVEVIPALQTNPDLVTRAMEQMRSWNKTPVKAKDTPGFIVNRVARPFYGEALRILEEGLASPQAVDAAMKACGFRMGPFELMDLIGNDINYAVTQSVFEAFYYDPRYRPSLIQKQFVDAGWLGRKSGRGYYHYESESSDKQTIDTSSLEWISERIIAMLINEAAEALYLNIASASDLDTAMTRGVNYPKGLLAWANERGIDATLEVLKELQEHYGEDRYRPSILLKQMAANQALFHLDITSA
jgi:3-hydroxybutyryl-CoA dehydrogenase